MKRWILFLVLFFNAVTAIATTDSHEKVLRVYGPGGPHQAIKECADAYSQKYPVRVEVVKALPHDLAKNLPLDGDIYYGGAEYMLEEFDQRNPGILNMQSVDKLKPRRIGIIVRKGNPHGIKGINDLSRDGIELLDVKLENMRHFYNNPDDKLRNVRKLEYTGRQGARAWRKNPTLDAWVTYKTWHVFLTGDSDFIEIDHGDAIRHIPVALTERTPHHQEAKNFIEFLKSAEAEQIFTNHGWD